MAIKVYLYVSNSVSLYYTRAFFSSKPQHPDDIALFAWHQLSMVVLITAMHSNREQVHFVSY